MGTLGMLGALTRLGMLLRSLSDRDGQNHPHKRKYKKLKDALRLYQHKKHVLNYILIQNSIICSSHQTVQCDLFACSFITTQCLKTAHKAGRDLLYRNNRFPPPSVRYTLPLIPSNSLWPRNRNARQSGSFKVSCTRGLDGVIIKWLGHRCGSVLGVGARLEGKGPIRLKVRKITFISKNYRV